MPAGLWRFLALAGALFALGFAIADTVYLPSFTDHFVELLPADGHSYARLRVVSAGGTAAQNGGLARGDVVEPVSGYTLRAILEAELPGTRHEWTVQRGAQPAFRTSTTVTQLHGNDLVLVEIFNAVRSLMILVGIIVVVRRPDAAVARALAAFLILIALTMLPGGVWLPDPALAAWRVLRGPLQLAGLGQMLHFACIFPFASGRGPRAWIERLNPWYTLLAAIAGFAASAWLVTTRTQPAIGPLEPVLDWMPIVYFPLTILAFALAVAQASGRDRLRAYWAAGSICIGFLGPLLQFVLYVNEQRADFMAYLPLTLIAIPIGLAYTILRHRTVDVGFVISRALVLTILSFIIVAAFGLLERALGKIFIDASHIASRTVEIALALGLGFSLRSLHARIERVVDRLLFRRRRAALAQLRLFSNDVYFITDPDVAIERTVEVVARCADAENGALYLIADGVFGRAAAIGHAGLPAEIDQNDPLFVRMRATRHSEFPRDTGSGVDAEIAFPMFVRGTLVGALALAAKRSGEAYDPEEMALLTELAQRVGIALDALQTIAMRRELEALMSVR
jgi:hypothetical protein